MSEDTDVMFRIGVMDHPQSKSALESLASNVEAAQARMTSGVEGIGQAANRVSSLVDSLTSNIDRLNQSSSAMRSAMPDAVQPMGANVRGGAPDSIVAQTTSVEAAVDKMQKKVDSFDPSKMSRSMQNVFAEMADVSSDSVDEIVNKLDESVASLAQNATAQSTVLREAYAASMVAHSEAYVEMSKDLDGYTAKHGSTMDRIAANLRIGEANLQRYREAADKATADAGKKFVEAGLSVAQMAKGFATLGLVSEENAQKFMQSLAVIQGSFDIVKGGIKAYTDLSDGLKKAREAKELLSKAQATQAALETAQLARLKAYHAQLVQEAAAANTAAAANSRLAASRTAAGVAAGGSGAVSGAGSMLGGAGAMIGGATAGTLAMAGAAAAGGVYLGGRAIYESASGQATQSDSSIAAMEARVAAWTIRLTGLFESTDAPMVRFSQSVSSIADSMFDYVPLLGGLFKQMNVFGDIAGLAASQAGVERGQRSLDFNKINREASEAQAIARAQADFAKDNQRFRSMSDGLRGSAINATSSFGFQGQTEQLRNQFQAMQERVRLSQVTDEGEIGRSTVSRVSNDATRLRGNPDAAFIQFSSEAQVFEEASRRYADAKANLDNVIDDISVTDEFKALAVDRVVSAQEEVVRSLEKQMQLSRQYGTNRLAIEREIQASVLAGIDQQQAKLEALENRRKSAMRSFVGMDAIERDMATRALEKARMGGGASLSQMEADMLGRVGTDETNRFVEQATEAQAKKLGFDTTFGTTMDDSRKQIEATRQQLEAQLQASFDVSMTVEADTDKVIDAIFPQIEQAMQNISDELERKIEQKLDLQFQKIETKRTMDLNSMRRG